MKRLTILLILLPLVSVAASKKIGDASTLGSRIDFQSTGQSSSMPGDQYDDTLVWHAFSHDDNSGANYYDLGPITNDMSQATANLQPSHIDSVGGIIVFDGIDDYISVADNSSLSGVTNLSVMGWVKIDTNTNGSDRILTKCDANTNGWQIFFSQGFTYLELLQARTGGASTFRATNYNFVTETYFHMAVTYDNVNTNNDAVWYKNGVEIPTDFITRATGAAVDNVGKPLVVGARFNAGVYDRHTGCTYSSVKLFNRLLTSNEVFTSFEDTKGTYGL